MSSNQQFGDYDYSLDLPWLVNGSIDHKQKKELTKVIDDSEFLQHELDLLVNLRMEVKSEGEKHRMSLEEKDKAWDRLITDIQDSKRTSGASIFYQYVTPKRFAIAASLMLGLTLTVLHTTQPTVNQYTPLSSENTSIDSRFKSVFVMRFLEWASETEVKTFLMAHDLSVFEGPDANGLVKVGLSKESHENGQSLLLKVQNNALIDYVQLEE